MVDCSADLLDDLDELQLDRVEPDENPGYSVDPVESLASDGMFQCSASTELDYSVDRVESLELDDRFHRCSEKEMGDKSDPC